MDRRHFGQATLALAGVWATARGSLTTREPREYGVSRAEALAAIEAAVGGRLGVAVLDSATGELAGHRLDERFPMCSTFKFLAAALVLARVDAGQEQLDRRVGRHARRGAGVGAGHEPAGRRRGHDGGGAVRGGDHGQRQHRGQFVAGERRRPGGADRVRAPHRRRRDPPGSHRADAQRGPPRRSARHLDAARDGADAAQACCSATRCRTPAARPAGALDDGQHHRRAPPAGGRPVRLARGPTRLAPATWAPPTTSACSGRRGARRWSW